MYEVRYRQTCRGERTERGQREDSRVPSAPPQDNQTRTCRTAIGPLSFTPTVSDSHKHPLPTGGTSLSHQDQTHKLVPAEFQQFSVRLQGAAQPLPDAEGCYWIMMLLAVLI